MIGDSLTTKTFLNRKEIYFWALVQLVNTKQYNNIHKKIPQQKNRSLLAIMEEINYNPLRIIEDDIPTNSDKSTDNDSNGEIFDFSASDIEELEGYGSSKTSESENKQRNSLLIIEDKDLIMDANEDFNNNNCESIHRLSLQVESGDSDSLVMTNEAVNRTIIRIGSNCIDFGESNVNEINPQQQQLESIHEAINHKANDDYVEQIEDEEEEEEEENFPEHADESDNVNSSDQVIVNILGKINEIVG